MPKTNEENRIKRENILLRFPTGLKDQVRTEATNRGLTMNAYLITVVREALKLERN